MLGQQEVQRLATVLSGADNPQRAASSKLIRSGSSSFGSAACGFQPPRRYVQLDQLGDWLLATRAGHYLSFALVAVLQIGLCATLWCVLAGNTIKKSVWMSYSFFIDTGTQTGLAAPDFKWVELGVGVVFSIMGWIFNMTLLGEVMSTMQSMFDNFKETRSRVYVSGHVVLLGWNDETIHFVTALCDHICLHSTRQVLVILAEEDEQAMHDEVQRALRERQGRCHGLTVHCRRGSPCDHSQLDRANAPMAAKVVLLGQDVSDNTIIRSMIALGGFSQGITADVYANMRSTDASFALRTMLPNTTVVHGHRLAVKLLCLMAANPSVAAMLLRLESHLLSVLAPESFDGISFGEARTEFSQSVLIGVKRNREPLRLAPPDEFQLLEGDHLVVVASGRLSGGKHGERGDRLVQRSMSALRLNSEGHGNGLKSYAELLSACAASEPVSVGSQTAQKSENAPVMVVLGWPAIPDYVLETLDKQAAPGTTVRMFAGTPMRVREEALAACRPLRNIQLEHHFGNRTKVADLSPLLQQRVTTVVVVEDQADADRGAIASDSECLLCAIMVMGIVERLSWCQAGASRPLIICEVKHQESKRMWSNNAELKSRCLLFRSHAHEAAMMVRRMTDPTLFEVYRELMQGRLRAHKPSDRVGYTTRRALADRLRQHNGGITVGWSGAEDEPPDVVTHADVDSLLPLGGGEDLFYVAGVTEERGDAKERLAHNRSSMSLTTTLMTMGMTQ